MPNIIEHLPVGFKKLRKAKKYTKYQHGLKFGIYETMYCRTLMRKNRCIKLTLIY